jgi:hypothetical protein
MDRDITAAAIERLEAEKRRRLDEKVAKGEAVRVPLPCVVLGVESDEQVAAEIESVKASKLAELRKGGETREIVFDEPVVIVTGVPRDWDSYVQGAHAGNVSETKAPSNASSEPPPSSEPVASEAPSQPRRVWTQIKPPSEDNPGGIIAEGTFTVSDGTIRVEDTQGRPLGSEILQPGDDAKAVARRLLREKRGGSFWDPLAYGSTRWMI